MGSRRTLSLGPCRTSAGLADVHFDGDRLWLTVLDGPVAVLDRYRMVVLGVAATAALAAWYVDPPARWVVLLAACVLAVVALAAPRRTGREVGWAEPDLDLMDPVHGALRVHLVIYTASQELRISGWFWRRRQLDHLQKRLAS